jgi:hypothetical protein
LSFSENGEFQRGERAGSPQPHGGFAKGSPQSTGGGGASTPRFIGWQWREMAHHQFQGSNPRHVSLGLTVSFSLQQFSEIFKIRDAAGQPYILIGGQAVNYWAERYLSTEPELELFQPFTSEDIDFKGGQEDVQRIARQLELPPGYPAKVEMTALAGVIPFQIGDLKSSIEIVRRVPGVSGTASIPAVEVEWHGKTIRVLDPISLLASKLELAATVPQNKRRDVAHLKILVPCVRTFLHEVLQQVERDETPARNWLGAANQTLKLTTSHRAKRIAGKFQIDWTRILPLAAIARCKDEKIRRFHEQQLQQGYRKSKGISI